MEMYDQQGMESLQRKEASHTSEAAQIWFQKNLPNLIPKSPDLNMWSVVNETTYNNTGQAQKATETCIRVNYSCLLVTYPRKNATYQATFRNAPVFYYTCRICGGLSRLVWLN